jgi:hypothetical protein
MRRGIALAAALHAVACGHDGGSPAAPPEPAATPVARAAPPRAGYSNIRDSDYVGPSVCGECHPDKHASWGRSLHRSMNRLVTDSAGVMVGDFSGARLAYAGGEVHFEPGPAMSFWRGGALLRRFRITRTIGSRYLQEYVGIQSEGPEPAGDPIYATEIRLPFGSWRRAGGWIHQQYYDSWYGPEWTADGRPAIDPYAVDPSPWAARCAWCHNTFPFELRAAREDGLGNGLEQFVALAPGAARTPVVGNRLPVERLVTVGVSCESCHLGGREHARGGARIRFDPQSPDLVPRPGAPDLSGGRRDPVVVNAICGQCHSTPSPRYPGGAVTRNSTEALDLAGSACAGAIKCTDCHDPHVAGPGPGAPDNPRHLAACARCHPGAAADQHGGHAARDASCLDCHMPRVVQGLSDVVRSHRIGSPASPADLEAGAPNACNLCHLDRPIAWTLAELARRTGRSTTVSPARYGGLDRPVGEAWLDSGDPQVRITAAAAYARAPRRLGRAVLPLLLDILDDPVAYDRMRVLFALEAIAGRRALAGYQPTAPPAERAAQLAALRARLVTTRGCASRAGARPDAAGDPGAPPAAPPPAPASAGRSRSRCRSTSR